MELNKNTRKWILILVAITLGMIWVMQRLALIPQYIGAAVSFFSPLLIGIMIAFVVNLPMRWIERRFVSKFLKKDPETGKNPARPLSMLLAFLLLLGIIAAVIFMVVPDLARTMVTFARQLQPAFRNFTLWLDKIGTVESPFSIFLQNSNLSINDLILRITNWINNTVTEILSSSFSWITGLLNGFLNFFIGFVFSIYFLMQKERLGRQLKQIAYAAFPEKFVDKVLQLGKLINTVFSRFLGGQGLEAVILGSLVFLGMQIFRFPYPLTISVLVILGALIPVFGATIAGVLGALLILVESPMQALWFLVMLIAIQQVEGNFIYPRVVGKSVGLPSIWVLAAVTFGSKMLGFFGLLLGVPIFSVLYILIRSWSWKRIEEKNISAEKLSYMTVSPVLDDEENAAAESPETPENLKTEAAAETRGRAGKPAEDEAAEASRAAVSAEKEAEKEKAGQAVPGRYRAERRKAFPLESAGEEREGSAGRAEEASQEEDAAARDRRSFIRTLKEAGRYEPRDETLIDQVTADWQKQNEMTEAENRGVEVKRVNPSRGPEESRYGEKAERESRSPEASSPKTTAQRGIRQFKASFDLDKVERELERETREAAEIRRRARQGRQAGEPREK